MSVKPLARWAILQQWTLRYTERGDEIVAGIFSTPMGSFPFRYERETRILHLPARTVHLDEHGWEINPAGRITFRSARSDHAKDTTNNDET
jgi:hypothetical protein